MTVDTNDTTHGGPAAPDLAGVLHTEHLPGAWVPSPSTPATCVQAASTAVPSASMQVAMVTGPGMAKAALHALFQLWVHGIQPAQKTGPDEVVWFISKRGTALINTWLNNKKLAGLHINGMALGAVVIPQDRVEHMRDGRASKDGVGTSGVIDLLVGLFIHGTPKYAPHPDSQKYPNQLLMFDPVYKSKDATASGESPVAALQFIGAPVAHLRLETAYWASPKKTKALGNQALRK